MFVSLTQNLVGRILPRHKNSFTFEVIPGKFGEDKFEIDGTTIRATSGVAAAYGFHYYLRHVAHASVHWGRNKTGINVDHIPSVLPRAPLVIRKKSSSPFRYYFNAVTFGYSSAWWDWERWEQEIDWAALHGINLFLALEGQEYLWEKLWLQYGLTRDELEHYFPGPAFLAWHRMNNMDSYMGPQPAGWRRQRFELQRKIVKRQREFGMLSVLSAFAGHIPPGLERAMKEKGRTISFHRGETMEEGWCGFAPTTTLNASDPLFQEIGKKFLELQTEAYGTDHIYSCDSWNENAVPFSDLPSLRQSSKAVIEGMMLADKQAVWLMQGWLFLFQNYWSLDRIAAYLSGVPDDRMVVLDLFAEKKSLWDKTESFFGKPWIWCQLLNFGGNHGIYGNMTRVAKEPARAMRESKSFAGVGMTMEAIERNPVMFSMLADTAWTRKEIYLPTWLQMYASSRYLSGISRGGLSVNKAWVLLNHSVYHYNGQLVKSVIDERPKYYDLHVWSPPAYEPGYVVQALRYFVEAVDAGEIHVNGPLLQDITDIARQVTCDLFLDLLLAFETLLQLGDHESMKHIRIVMLELLLNLDKLLETNINYMLGPVLDESLRYGIETEEQVRNILTLWGDGRILNDYAAKEWSPIVKNYYYRRWDLWLSAAVKQTTEYPVKVHEFEQNWYKQSNIENLAPAGKTMKFAKALLNKYAATEVDDYEAVVNAAPKFIFHYHRTWTRDVGIIRTICEETPSCGGFTSTGLLFLPGAKLEMASGVVVYLKKEGKRATFEQVTNSNRTSDAVLVGMLLCLMLCGGVYLLFRVANRTKKAK